jgi:uncharacterized protein (TIGR03792 family)
MVIEWLKVKITPELREKYIQKDDEIWTAALSRYPGFLGKQVWLDPKRSDEVTLVIQWQSKQAWESVSAEHMQETEKKFAQAMGNASYKFIETGEYQVRKFPRKG